MEEAAAFVNQPDGSGKNFCLTQQIAGSAQASGTTQNRQGTISARPFIAAAR